MHVAIFHFSCYVHMHIRGARNRLVEEQVLRYSQVALRVGSGTPTYPSRYSVGTWVLINTRGTRVQVGFCFVYLYGHFSLAKVQSWETYLVVQGLKKSVYRAYMRLIHEAVSKYELITSIEVYNLLGRHWVKYNF